jgi:hypothetical protein
MTIAGPTLRPRAARRFAVRRWSAVAAVACAQGGCAAIAGLDAYSSGTEVGDATVATREDAAGDTSRVEAASKREASTPVDAAEPDGEPDGEPDANPQEPDAEGEASTSGPDAEGEASTSAADAQAESGVDASGTDASTCDASTCSGQCVSTSSNLSNCGGCGQVCNPANVNHAECTNSACSYDTCAAGFGDCDSNRANGCEANLSEPDHCGSCSTTCSSGLCGTSIAGWTTSPTLWKLNGNTTLGSGPFGTSTAILTGAVASEVGTIIYANPIVTDGFTATFSIYLGGGPGGGNDGDGMGFMWQTQGATAIGGSGGCLGMCGLPGFGVEFDTYNNDTCGDMNANHVAVDELSGCSTAFPTHITATGSTLPTLDGTSHSVVVTLASGAVSVTIDDISWLSGVSLPGFVSGTAYYFGFAGGTGGATDAHEVSPSLSITFPTPRCL